MSIEMALKCSFVVIVFISLAQGGVGKDSDSPKQRSCAASCNLNNGECGADGFCRCHKGWHGENCDQCMRAVGCRHGTCQEPDQCICKRGYGGRHCQLDMMYCEHHQPCKNGATCVNDDSGSYSCQCPPGYFGKNCFHQRTSLIRPPKVTRDQTRLICSNGGTCTMENCKECSCPRGFVGKRCETQVRMCVARPCANGARCHDIFGEYRCDCANGFTGKRCEKDVNECSILGDSACENGGSCVNLKGSYTCQCLDGFEGARCDKLVQRIQPTSTQARKQQKSSNSAMKVLIQKNHAVPRDSSPVKKTQPKQSSTNIKYTHIVKQVEVSAVNSDGAFGDHVDTRLVQVHDSIDAEQTSISIVQAVTFAFLGVAIILFVIIALVVWLHHSRRRKGRCLGFKENLTDDNNKCDDNRSSMVIDNESDIVETSDTVDSYNLTPGKMVCTTSPLSVVCTEKSRSADDFLYVSLPQNSSTCSKNTDMNCLMESTFVS